jgi:hypothetical protein
MSEYPTLKEYVLSDIESLEQDYTLTIQQEIKDLVAKVLDILPDFEFEGGKPFYPSANCDPNILFGVATVELRWQYPSMMKGHFIIDFQTSDDPLSYSVFIAENHYSKTASGTFESLCSELAHEFQKFCMDY